MVMTDGGLAREVVWIVNTTVSVGGGTTFAGAVETNQHRRIRKKRVGRGVVLVPAKDA